VTSSSKYLREQFGVVLPRRSHPDWQKIQTGHQQPQLHGHKLWGASRLLMDYLSHHPLEKNLRILDLGCGWGITSVFCAKQFQARVIANDADPAVFPYVDFLAQLNDCKIESLIQTFDQISNKTLSHIDILIGADICFWDHLSEPVFDVIQRAVETGVKKIIIADPNRPPFIAAAEACVNEFFGELLPWKTAVGGKTSGSILIIENS
jgi:predicted nicotinamide N-methyase